MEKNNHKPDTVVGGIPVIYRPARPVDDPVGRYPGLRPGCTTLAAGTVLREGALPLPCAITVDRDLAVTLRDGPHDLRRRLPAGR